ncbi:hypothetical protein Tco_0838177 [Tanacetum coccineum]|uniref:Uncharacterized protein n=1 Tax=Tanacetum coccineum TaxID=301880 RepID=A0ABQ5AM06_9ASTR
MAVRGRWGDDGDNDIAKMMMMVGVMEWRCSSSVSAGYIIEFMLEDLEAVPADYVPADLIYRQPMPTIPTQSPFTYPNPNPSASPSFTQDDTSESFIPEPTQPMPTFTQTAFSQPAVNYQQDSRGN